MQSSLIGKIQKANLYAREPDRVTFRDLSVTFRGDNDSHSVAFRNDHWSCDCDFFGSNDICTHVMAIQKLMGTMLPSEARYWPGSGAAVAGSANGVGV
jgi:hypothetical protein